MRASLEAQCATLLRLITTWAGVQYARCHGATPFEEFLDAGREALTTSWARFDSTRGASFQTYAAVRIRWAIVDAGHAYTTWRACRLPRDSGHPHADAISPPGSPRDDALDLARRLAALPRAIQRLAASMRQGMTQAELGARWDVTEAQMSQFLLQVRRGTTAGSAWKRALILRLQEEGAC